MTKKWLYSVAVGALLMAGEALGITVHDVLSNGFWSATHRGTYEYLNKVTHYRAKGVTLKNIHKMHTDGIEETMNIYAAKGPKIDGLKWRTKWWEHGFCGDGWITGLDKEKLTAIRNKIHREKSLAYTERREEGYGYRYLMTTNMVKKTSATYTVKSLKKEVRPMQPLVLDDWFPGSIEKTRVIDGRFYGTEENAVTNIVSNNEAYITRTIAQTGYIENFHGYPINEDASLLRTYNTHITTDDDHVYVDQTICENSINNPRYNQQDAYQTQYVATFKKGQWKSATETITHVSNLQSTDWFLNYQKQQHEQTTRVSSQQPDHWTMNQRPRQNSR